MFTFEHGKRLNMQIVHRAGALDSEKIGSPELALPRKIVAVKQLPLLGNGKTDYLALNQMAESAA